MTSMLEIGTQGLYEWLVTDKDFDLVDLCPEIVTGAGPLFPVRRRLQPDGEALVTSHIAQGFKLLRTSRTAAGMNGTSSNTLWSSVQATFERTCSKCLTRSNMSASS